MNEKSNKTNTNGKLTEAEVERILDARNIASTKNPSYIKPDGRKGRSDRLIPCLEGISIRIEVKHQEASGSKEETIDAFHYRMNKNCFHEDLVILVMSGEKFEKQTEIYKYCLEQQNKIERFRVCRIEDFGEEIDKIIKERQNGKV